jgi:PIN domain nuclease of toxin-antitoxin system
MPEFVTDSHGLIWYLTRDKRLGPAASAAFASCDAGDTTIWIPAICLVEMLYLEEKGRIAHGLRDLLDQALATGSTGFDIAPLDAPIARHVEKVSRAEVPELPDRVIAATAVFLKAQLISKDRKITSSSVQTIW